MMLLSFSPHALLRMEVGTEEASLWSWMGLETDRVVHTVQAEVAVRESGLLC